MGGGAGAVVDAELELALRVGDLVSPFGSVGFMMVERGEDGFSFDVVSRDDAMVGIVVEVVGYSPVREYDLVKILVGGLVGWTYSDYVQVV